MSLHSLLASQSSVRYARNAFGDARNGFALAWQLILSGICNLGVILTSCLCFQGSDCCWYISLVLPPFTRSFTYSLHTERSCWLRQLSLVYISAFVLS